MEKPLSLYIRLLLSPEDKSQQKYENYSTIMGNMYVRSLISYIEEYPDCQNRISIYENT